MFNKKVMLIKRKLILGITVLIFFMLMGCSQTENQSNKTNINPTETIPNVEVPLDTSEKSAIEI